jgi:hypothetical protein
LSGGKGLVAQNWKPNPDESEHEIAILMKQRDAQLCWVEAAHDVEAARARIKILEDLFPGEYVLVNHRSTGREIEFP